MKSSINLHKIISILKSDDESNLSLLRYINRDVISDAVKLYIEEYMSTEKSVFHYTNYNGPWPDILSIYLILGKRIYMGIGENNKILCCLQDTYISISGLSINVVKYQGIFVDDEYYTFGNFYKTACDTLYNDCMRQIDDIKKADMLKYQ
jgi:hypothetical protein